MERRAQEDREEARRREIEAKKDYEEREEETRRQNEQREYDLRHSALMEMENKYLAQQLAAAEKEKDLILQHEREKAEMLMSQKMLELEKQKIAEEKLLASQKNAHVETGSTGSRDQSEKFANKINLQDKIISEAEKQSTSASKLFLQEEIISAQKDSLSHAEINLENKLLLDSLMSDADADAFVSQFDSLPVDVYTDVVCSQPLVDLSSWPTPPTGLHTSMSAPTATTLLQQHDVNTLAPSLDSHHPPLVPATTATAATTQPAHPASACIYSQPTLGVHITATGYERQQSAPAVVSQSSPAQSVYTQPVVCQSSALRSTATILLPGNQPSQSSVSAPAVNVDTQPCSVQSTWMSPASVHSYSAWTCAPT